MSNRNRDIAIKWARDQVGLDKPLVWSNEFFKPFNAGVRRAMTRELDQMGILAWSDTKTGAFLIRKDDPRLTITQDDKVKIGLYQSTNAEGDPCMLFLPALPV